ncbi:uncharacterized protein LOC135632601 [Musa acuminata AAA Group]|uniref:uncharacterized protein LOC135632601 n=1 Tax=Musa acuminata AAA Group TaxID=214697 RepID=UPI0031DEF385
MAGSTKGFLHTEGQTAIEGGNGNSLPSLGSKSLDGCAGQSMSSLLVDHGLCNGHGQANKCDEQCILECTDTFLEPRDGLNQIWTGMVSSSSGSRDDDSRLCAPGKFIHDDGWMDGWMDGGREGDIPIAATKPIIEPRMHTLGKRDVPPLDWKLLNVTRHNTRKEDNRCVNRPDLGRYKSGPLPALKIQTPISTGAPCHGFPRKGPDRSESPKRTCETGVRGSEARQGDERERGGKVTLRWGPQLDQATYKNRQRLYLSEQFNEEAHSPFVKEYKTIIHPGEVLIWDVELQPNRHPMLGATESRPDLGRTMLQMRRSEQELCSVGGWQQSSCQGSSPHDPDPRPCLGHFNRNVGSPKGQANASMATRLSKLQQQLEVEKHATYDAQADQCCYHDMALKS